MMAAIEQGKRGHETFRWQYDVYDITAVLADLERGSIEVSLLTTFNRHEIAAYRALLEGVPHPDIRVGTQEHQIHVDLAYASTLTEADLARPIIVLHVGHDEGPLELADLEKGHNYVVADGNHRLIRAYQLGIDEVPVVVLLEPEASRYRSPVDFGTRVDGFGAS